VDAFLEKISFIGILELNPETVQEDLPFLEHFCRIVTCPPLSRMAPEAAVSGDTTLQREL